jgi:hypothetical protein
VVGTPPPGARSNRGADVAGMPRRANEAAAANGGEEAGSAMARAYARARERDDAVRASLVPLAPGERPRAVTAAALLAAVIAVGNLALIVSGWEVDGERPVAGGLVFAGVMAVAAIAMWRVKYWAVLGFQVLLGVSLVFGLLALLRASNLGGVLVAVAVVAISGPLFWFLIRAMARMQAPPRPPVG